MAKKRKGRMTPEERATRAHYADGHAKSCSPCCAIEIGFITQAIRDAIKEEREACACIASDPYGDEVEALGPNEPKTVGLKIAIAIRARGQT